MFLDDKSIKNKNSDHPVNLFSSTLKQNVINQAASMLLQYVTLHKNRHHITQNNNGNAFDEHHLSLRSIQRKKKEFRRTDKCNSWLSNIPTKSDTSLKQTPMFIDSLSYHPQRRITLSSNAVSNMNPQYESFSQPLVLVHKKRLRRDYFLSTMQNCIQPPYSENHFYAFDQTNMLKLQRNLQRNNYFHSKRKYSEEYDDDDEPECICSETQLSPTTPPKRDIPSPIEQSSPKTADHISINKYHNEKSDIDMSIQNPSSEQSHRILSRLEKILNLCGELRTLAKDVENHLNEKTTNNDKNEPKKSQSEIDIYEELDIQPTIDEKNAPSDQLSIHSQTDQSHPLMHTESFGIKSPNEISSKTTLRKPEDICSCFLKSMLVKENCKLNPNEQEYLNELTKAYLLGREQILKEQHEEHNKFQAFLDKTFPREKDEGGEEELYINNNNQSSMLFYNNFQKIDNDVSRIPPSEILSTKHKTFLNEPIAMKPINVLPGIGTKYAQQLAECGFLTVRRLLGFYLMIKDDQHFVIWLNNKAGISIHSAWLCTNTLRTWCQTYL